jgi:hypothetical protein
MALLQGNVPGSTTTTFDPLARAAAIAWLIAPELSALLVAAPCVAMDTPATNVAMTVR